MKPSPVSIGDYVVFADPYGVEHDALITQVWDNGGDSETYPNPGVNLVYVSGDESKHDQYGQQIERTTSVVHRTSQSAHGMFWRRIDE